ncbi:glycoside hydrolase family 3 C-terminal domain-containing protein [Nocardioides massiliensis]|uniref:Beta-glucosidase n=1 Tax=Nocardioides massiliensis TaxID=1325935 RepID=A0ABT9NNG2_9ACTN|nr:glycoside hydrolase family 3 C-terminal domain-containing protein [Nocardioides massiliensis]MDP9821375.1 beta-glucosidase [Nocardioides massiliensis]
MSRVVPRPEDLAAAAEVVATLTTDEKVALLSGASFWETVGVEHAGIAPVVLTDGPHGVRRQAGDADHLGINDALPATAFPTAAATGSSWDPALLSEIGAALAVEARALGVDVLLGPGVNIKRHPLCGRNFEYFSEDPRLSGALGAAWVRGLQDNGVAACVKHFAANNQETNRMRVSAEVDERTLREIYLPAFETVVEAGVATVMCAYNALNGTPTAHHPWLLTAVLREEWGFSGAVVSDWGAVTDPAASAAAGLDLEMPGTAGASAERLLAALADGTLAETELDRAAAAVVALVQRAAAARAAAGEVTVDFDAHHALARRAAADSAVLLTNDGILPLDPSAAQRLALIGPFARTPRYQGAGSSHINPPRVDDPVVEIETLLAARGGGTQVCHDDGSDVGAAVALAEASDTVVLFLGLPAAEESEGFDRTHLDLPADQLALLAAVAAVNPRVVVVLGNGGAVLTAPVEQHANAVLETWLGGQAVGGAIADVLFGVREPGGRLAETVPLALTDTPAYVNFPGTATHVHYGERVYVGYRWYDRVERAVAHPFGHGLGYTTWAYADLTVAVPDPTVAAATVSVTVTNTGEREGSEVVQVYLSDLAASVDRPVRELVGFAKVRLAPGESERVEIALDERAFAFWDATAGQWAVEPGAFRVEVGSSSRALPMSVELELDVPRVLGPLTLDSPMGEWLERPGAMDVMLGLFSSAIGDDVAMPELDESLLAMVASMPLRQVLTMAGAVPDPATEAAALARLESTR